MKMIQRKQDQDGFTLIELALVITILGLIIAPLFSFLGGQLVKEKQVLSQNREKTILSALSIYIKQNNRYPCPARANVGLNSGNFGREVRNGPGTACANAGGISTSNAPLVNRAALGLPNLPADTVYIGAIPTHALNLPYRYASNEQGVKYIYAVTGRKANSNNFANSSGRIIILDSGGTQATANEADFALVDPGPNAEGSYMLDGTTMVRPCNATGGLDNANCDGDRTFRDAPYSTALGANFNDDTIEYTLIREDTSFWAVTNSTSPGSINVTARNNGNVGIGTNNPNGKLHVNGGNILVQGVSGNGGRLLSEYEIRSPTFYYE